MCVAIEKAELDGASRLSEMVEDRALIHAIAAPCAGQAEHFHLALETGEQLPLRFAEPHRCMNSSPSPAMFFRAVLGEELGVGEAVGEVGGVVEHDGGEAGAVDKRGGSMKYIAADAK